MEDVLEVYHREYQENEVLVCLDETSKQQVKETRQPRPPRPGAAGIYDFEYERNGVSNLFMLFAPLEGWRRVEVTQRRTKADWAQVVRKLVDEDYAHKDRIVLVMDNLNTHHPSSLYEAFDPTEARRIAERRELHAQAWHKWLVAAMPFLNLGKEAPETAGPNARGLSTHHTILGLLAGGWLSKEMHKACTFQILPRNGPKWGLKRGHSGA